MTRGCGRILVQILLPDFGKKYLLEVSLILYHKVGTLFLKKKKPLRCRSSQKRCPSQAVPSHVCMRAELDRLHRRCRRGSNGSLNTSWAKRSKFKRPFNQVAVVRQVTTYRHVSNEVWCHNFLYSQLLESFGLRMYYGVSTSGWRVQNNRCRRWNRSNLGIKFARRFNYVQTYLVFPWHHSRPNNSMMNEPFVQSR